jgi:RNA-binding protein
MLTSAQRKALKSQAHKLEPVVLVGGKGLTDAVLAEVDGALKAHELIKVRAPGLERGERDRAFRDICERTRAELVQQVGKVAVLYRRKAEPGS